MNSGNKNSKWFYRQGIFYFFYFYILNLLRADFNFSLLFKLILPSTSQNSAVLWRFQPNPNFQSKFCPAELHSPLRGARLNTKMITKRLKFWNKKIFGMDDTQFFVFLREKEFVFFHCSITLTFSIFKIVYFTDPKFYTLWSISKSVHRLQIASFIQKWSENFSKHSNCMISYS